MLAANGTDELLEDVLERDEPCCTPSVVGDKRDVSSTTAHGEEHSAQMIGGAHREQRAYEVAIER